MQVSRSPIPLIRSRDDHAGATDRGWRSGKLTRLARGTYVDSKEWSGLPPWQKYLVKVHGAIAANPHRVICDESAAALLGALIAYPKRPVHILLDGGTSREYKGVRTHVSVDQREIIVVDGIRMTSPANTAVDIARSRPPAEALAYADALLRIDPTITPQSLISLNEELVSGRGRRHARWALEHSTGIPESVLESASSAVIDWLGYEPPIMQQQFYFEGERDRSDFYWPDANVVAESDGDLKYSGSLDDPTAAIIKEKRRENRLRRNTSGMARWGWPELEKIEPVDQALRAAGLFPTRPRDTMMLASFRPFGRD